MGWLLKRTHCDWCGRELAPLNLRPEAECCSSICRKRRHRFGATCVAAHRAASPLVLTYADPPYPGKAYYYEGHPDYAGEVDHRALICELEVSSNGWALSTSAEALSSVLAICRELRLDVEIAAWVRGARGNVQAKRPRSAWEPVIYRGGRGRENPPADALVYGKGTRSGDPKRVIGAKPGAFAFWIFELLGALPGDRFVDRFPGSGGIARAWAMYERQAIELEASRRPLRPTDASAEELAGLASHLEAGRVDPETGTRREDLRDASSSSPGAPGVLETRPSADGDAGAGEPGRVPPAIGTRPDDAGRGAARQLRLLEGGRR